MVHGFCQTIVGNKGVRGVKLEHAYMHDISNEQFVGA